MVLVSSSHIDATNLEIFNYIKADQWIFLSAASNRSWPIILFSEWTVFPCSLWKASIVTYTVESHLKTTRKTRIQGEMLSLFH